MNILQPALLVPLFSSLYSGASLTPLRRSRAMEPDAASSGGPEAMVASTWRLSSPGGADTSVTPPLLQRPTAMAASTFPDVARWIYFTSVSISAYYDLSFYDFDGAVDRRQNPRVAVRARWAESSGHPASAPRTRPPARTMH